jgi:hypothetical protein
MKFRIALISILIGLFSTPSFAVIDSTAPVVSLRNTCQNGGTTLNNCFTSMPPLLTWIYGTRVPTATSPLLVDVGPGTFGGFHCGIGGHITVRGSGRNNTILASSNVGTTEPNMGGLGGTGFGCVNLVFQDLTFDSSKPGGQPPFANSAAFAWFGAGNATWVNVALLGQDYGWWDIRYSSAASSQHYWLNSIITASPNASAPQNSAAFKTYGATHRIFGSEINLFANSNIAGAMSLGGEAGIAGEVQMYASPIRAKAAPNASLSKLRGVEVGANQTFHMHGSTIGVNAEAASSSAVDVEGIGSAVAIIGGGFYNATTLHVIDVAYALKPKGAGISTRLWAASNHGIEAPFWWGSGLTPPTLAPDGLDGADIFVETDCSIYSCQGTGIEPHLLIYTSKCTGTGGPWFDTTVKTCR